MKINIGIWVPGRSVNEKEAFYELMDKVVTSEKVSVGSDFNGHVGSDMVVLEKFIGGGVGGYGMG